jgi:hypothetical protein
VLGSDREMLRMTMKSVLKESFSSVPYSSSYGSIHKQTAFSISTLTRKYAEKDQFTLRVLTRAGEGNRPPIRSEKTIARTRQRLSHRLEVDEPGQEGD